MNQDSFLSQVCQSLKKEYGEDLSGVTIVFPGKRASIFMNNILAQQAEGPVWAPQYTTIADIYHQNSRYETESSVAVICLMHQIYTRLYLENGYEPMDIDRFWGWGEIILKDFDDIDKHMADAKAIFRNVDELREMDDLSYLDDHQTEVLCRFFKEFAYNHESRIQGRFLSLWSLLGRLYDELKAELKTRGRLYEGALQREVAEQIKSGNRSIGENGKRYAFVGFNVLNPVEIQLMKSLQAEGRALFYWDYDVLYRDGQEWEAGEFLREAISLFPSPLPQPQFDNLSKPKNITFVSTQSDNIQARFLPQWIDSHLTKEETDTAVVLCDEHMLQPVLHSLPTNGSDTLTPKSINITMGFPLQDTPVYSTLSSLLTLQTEGYDLHRKRFRTAFLRAARRNASIQQMPEELWNVYQGDDQTRLLLYLQKVNKYLSKVYALRGDNAKNVQRQLYAEAIFRTNQILQNFIDMCRDPRTPMQVGVNTLKSLLRRVLSTTTINFHGEPARGMQVIGVLETRCLDFKNVILLNVGEGTMPRNVHDSSIIPLPIRQAYELTTPKHKISVNAYYFFRLLQRAEDITLVYNANNLGNSHHEISRFMRQMEALTDWDIKHYHLQADQAPLSAVGIPTEKTPEVVEALAKRTFSPTAINCYIDCPKQFYFQYVAGLKRDEDIDEEVDAALMGTIFHTSAQFLYEYLAARSSKREITPKDLSALLNQDNHMMEDSVTLAFICHYFMDTTDEKEIEAILQKCISLPERDFHKYVEDRMQQGAFTFNGIVILQRDVIDTYLRNLVKWDQAHDAFILHKTESYHTTTIPVETASGTINVKVGGRVDRMDIRDNKVHIIDYKTGGNEPQGKITLESLFETKDSRASHYLQALLYCLCLENSPAVPHLPMKPALFHVNKASNPNYSPYLNIEGEELREITECLMGSYRQLLSKKLAEILDPEKPFSATTLSGRCTQCAFAELCH